MLLCLQIKHDNMTSAINQEVIEVVTVERTTSRRLEGTRITSLMEDATEVTTPFSTTTQAAPDTDPCDLLTPERVEELRKRVEKPARTPVYTLAKNQGLRLWKYVVALNDWMGGTPLSQRERAHRVLLESGASYTRHTLV